MRRIIQIALVIIVVFLVVTDPVALARTRVDDVHTRLTELPNYELAQNLTGVTRNIIVEWTKTQAGQDRFNPEYIIVNQWDTIDLTFINNDTVAHDLVIGSPYNIVVNATVPGLYNDLTGQEFTTPATGNSPGVKVSGTPGNVSAWYSFVAKYAGIFEFVCSYHTQVGMIGYLVVLSSSSSIAGSQSNTTSQVMPPSSNEVQVSIDQGSGTNVNLPGYSPTDIRVVIGVNNTVRWTNNDNMAHTVTATDGSFDSGNMNAGDSFVHTFNQTGTFAYICVYHHWMHGSVTVIGSANEPASAGFATYGLVAVGIIVLVAILIFFSRSGRPGEGG